jgi:hypothetical protein
LVKFSSSFIKRTVKNIDLYQRTVTDIRGPHL